MRHKAKIKAQKFIYEENVQELALTKQEVMCLISLLSSYAEHISPLDQILVLHYLPLKDKVESALLKGIQISRLGTLIHIEQAYISQAVKNIDIDNELIRVALWLDICDN